MASVVSTNINRARPVAQQIFKNAVVYRPDSESQTFAQPQMVILFTWLGAKERYAHKFVQSWTKHGFNVMHVTTNVLDLLMPKTKSEVTVHRVVDHLLGQRDCNFIIHGLSVGGYLGTRVVMESQNTDVVPRISHQIFDSFMHTRGLQDGVVHAVSDPFQNVANKIGRLYSNYADLSIFRKTEHFLEKTPHPIPTYYMHSLGDYVARFEWVRHFTEAQANRSPTSLLLIPETKKIPHVALFRMLGEGPYMSSIFNFLNQHNFPVKTKYSTAKETEELAPLEKVLKKEAVAL